ncbi:hypothetical protein PINS_up006533 [Pythium insidiosum]|nr:hypothetical protein PINS_up006533 [Pythium insidiosum]
MLGVKTLCSLVLLATTATLSVSAETPQLRGSDDPVVVDAAAKSFANLEAFEQDVMELARKYGIALDDSAVAKEHLEHASDVMANDLRVINKAKADASVASPPAPEGGAVARANRCKLTVDAAAPTSLKLNCNANTIRFATIGDWGEKKTNAGLNAVRDALLGAAGSLDFVVSVGDNFYSSGVSSITDSQWTNTWVSRYGIGSTLSVPWFSLLGNHDHYGNSNAQIEYSKATQPGSKYWIMPSEFYNVDVTDARGKKLKLVVTDTETITDDDHSWVKQQITDASAEFALVFGHYQVFSAGGRGDNKDAKVKRLNALLQDGGNKARAYLCGHEHDMQFLQSGKLDYFMLGGGGRKVDYGDVSPGTDAKVQFYARNYGFGIFDVDIAARSMSVTYQVFDKNGRKVDTKVFQRSY